MSEVKVIHIVKLRWSTEKGKWLIIFDNGERLFAESVSIMCYSYTSKDDMGEGIKCHITILYQSYNWVTPDHIIFR